MCALKWGALTENDASDCAGDAVVVTVAIAIAALTFDSSAPVLFPV
jgi:hypothetical protein